MAATYTAVVLEIEGIKPDVISKMIGRLAKAVRVKGWAMKHLRNVPSSVGQSHGIAGYLIDRVLGYTIKETRGRHMGAKMKPEDLIELMSHVGREYLDEAIEKKRPEKRNRRNRPSKILDVSQEQKMAESLEDMDEVLRYVKNHNLHFLIPYTAGGDHKNYMPDFIVRLDDGHGKDNAMNLIVEVTGQRDGKRGKLKHAKVTTARTLYGFRL